MPFTFRQNNNRHRCALLDEHIASVSLLMTCSQVIVKIHVINYQRHLYFSSLDINVSEYLLVYCHIIRSKYTNCFYKKCIRSMFIRFPFLVVQLCAPFRPCIPLLRLLLSLSVIFLLFPSKYGNRRECISNPFISNKRSIAG